ncbi:unnamed protein product [Sympodiomycopsis kandeliae]
MGDTRDRRREGGDRYRERRDDFDRRQNSSESRRYRDNYDDDVRSRRSEGGPSRDRDRYEDDHRRYEDRYRIRSPREGSSSTRDRHLAEDHSRRHSSRSQRRSRSPASPAARRRNLPPSPPPVPQRLAREPSEESQPNEEEEENQPDFGSSGLLAKESNQVNGTALKYHEPPEAKQPKKKWRLYVFKDGEEVDLFHISRQSCYLFGRDRTVVDIPLDHSSCSKQHAVIQYRLSIERNEFGDEKRNVKPYLLDLDSANGSTVNKKNVPASRYYELKNGDTVRFAASEREYVLLCEDS